MPVHGRLETDARACCRDRLLLAIGYGAVFVYGLFAVGNDDINFLSLNQADNWLHIVSTIVGLVIALHPVRQRNSANRARD